MFDFLPSLLIIVAFIVAAEWRAHVAARRALLSNSALFAYYVHEAASEYVANVRLHMTARQAKANTRALLHAYGLTRTDINIITRAALYRVHKLNLI